MPSLGLTKRHIDAIAYPKTSEHLVRDAKVRGLVLRVTKGHKSFLVEKRIKGRLHKVTLGPYGVLTLEQARAKAQATISKLLNGESLTGSRGEATFAQLAEDYLHHHVGKQQLHNERSILKTHLTRWKPWKVSAVTRRDVARLHAHVGKQSPLWSNRILAFLKVLFKWGLNYGYLEGENPAHQIKQFPAYS